MATYGTRFCESVAEYLRANRLFNKQGKISLGRINSTILADLADRFEQAERRRDKAERSKKLGKAERDRLFEALARGTGSDPDVMTDVELRRCAVAISAIIKATPDVRPEDVEAACKRYATIYHDASISTTAVSSNWSKLFDPKKRSAAGVPNGVDLAREPQFDWKRVVGVRYPRERYPDRSAWEEGSWSLVPSHIRFAIWTEGPKILAEL